ncbi:glycosyltransferase [Dawidia soli]|uniref:Glycosyltransferase n=1 Tax=Dawidia soli TaxID=2782352 RepID=A0AAP2D9U9_9BACT|nr:glycosyltransferase [Dawidia soli]MBT1686730.1 glycosyltransferase [Dawidia soli]
MGERVLYLSYDGLTDPLGQSQILPYLAGLAGAGHRISIISFEKDDKLETGGERIRQFCRQNNLTWHPLRYHKRPPVFSTVYDVWCMRQSARKLHAQESFTIVHCRSYITALVGRWLKNRHAMRFVFDMRGFWADERVEGGLWNLNSPLYRRVYNFFKRQEHKFLNDADAVTVLTVAAREELLSWGVADKITVIPCCVDLQLFDRRAVAAADTAAWRTRLGISPRAYVLLYLGSIGTWYLWNEMVLFFERLKKEHTEAKFLILTPDPEKVIPHPDFIVRTVSRQEVPTLISVADASVCFIKPSFSKKGSSATKMAEVLAMGVPVITNPGWGDVAFLADKLNNLVVTDPYAQQTPIIPVSSEPGSNAFFTGFFSLEEGVRKYDVVYRGVRQ